MKIKMMRTTILLSIVWLALFSCSKSESARQEAYNPVTIGSQVWMGENLNVITYRNGDPIPLVTDPVEWNQLTTGAWCYYSYDSAIGAVYGRLYNWYAVTDPRGLAPAGWHISTEEEWTDLKTFLGGEDIAGGRMKYPSLWYPNNEGSTNSSGFSALGGGSRNANGSFFLLYGKGFWWTSYDDAQGNGCYEYMTENSLGAYHAYDNNSDFKKNGFSVRCVRD
jgi:uncharacterized protein (TIGR02145 family)